MANVLEIIKNEITQDYYKNNFPNDGQRFVAWYLRNIHNLDTYETKDCITDGAGDKQIDAIYIDNQSKSVLIGERIFNETELNSRLEVELEKYTMKVQIEGRVLGDLAINHIVPTAVAYQNRLLENLRGLKEIFPAEESVVLSADRKELIREISHRVTSIKVLVRDMTEARKVANHMENYKERAFAYEEKVRPYLDQIRDHIDHLEMEVDDEIWPLPKYRELLFTK